MALDQQGYQQGRQGRRTGDDDDPIGEGIRGVRQRAAADTQEPDDDPIAEGIRGARAPATPGSPSSAPSPPPASRPPLAPTGDIDLRPLSERGGAPNIAGSLAPAPRRGPLSRVEDAASAANSFLSEDRSATIGRALDSAIDQLATVPDFSKPRDPNALPWESGRPNKVRETRRALAIPDRRTAEERLAQARANMASQIGQRPDATLVAPKGSEQSLAINATVAASNSEQEALRAQFTPKQWRDVARRGMEYANQLHAEGKHDEAEDANKKAYNAQLLADGAQHADTFGAIALSNLLGIVRDPYAGERRNMNEIAASGSTFTPEEQRRDLGKNLPAPLRREMDLSDPRDVVAPLVGGLPVFVAGGALERAALRGVGGLGVDADLLAAGRAPDMMGPNVRLPLHTRIADALAHEAETTGLYGPKQAGLAGVKEAAGNFAENLPTLARRGAVQGQTIGAAMAAREAQQTGGDPLEAAVGSVIANVPMGIAGEVLGGAASRLAGVAERSAQPLFDRARGAMDDVRGIDRDLTTRMETVPASPLDRRLLSAVDQAREVEGKTPVSDMTPSGQHQTIGEALHRTLDQQEAVETFGDQGVPPEPEVSPPLRTAAGLATEQAGGAPADVAGPADHANAVVQMQRAEAEHAAMAAEVTRQQDEARSEAAASQRAAEQRGPRPLGDALGNLKPEADADVPVAAEYHTAINDFVNASARMTDAGETPNERTRVDFARARAALNDARRKYGVQTGAAAIAALSSADSDLTDEERKAVGLGALAIGATAMVRHLPPSLRTHALDTIGALATTDHFRASPTEWMSHLETRNVSLGEHYTDVHQALVREAGGSSSTPITAVQARAAIESLSEPPAVQEPASRGLVSRLRTAIETLPGKAWDAPRPAGDWLGKLSGMNTFSKAELESVRGPLEYAQQQKVKLTRAQVSEIVQRYAPDIERHTLMEGGDRMPVEGGNPSEVHDFGEVENSNDRGYVQEQIDNRHARIREIDDEIEHETDDARATVDRAARGTTRTVENMRALIDEHFPDADAASALQDAIHLINEEVSSDYVPRGTVEQAWNEFVDNSNVLSSLHDPIDPEKQGLDVYKTSDGHWIVRDHNGDVVSTPQPTRFEALARAEQSGAYDAGGYSSLLPDGFTVEARDDGEFALRDGQGRVLASDADRETLIDDYVRDNFEGHSRDNDLSSLRSLFEQYAENWATLSEADSQHDMMSNDPESHFHEQYREREQLEGEIESLHSTLATLPDDMPTPEAAPSTVPKITGKPKYASYQRIGGGTNYRELVNRWTNNPGEAYRGGHYGSTANLTDVVGHVRAEDHVIETIPGLTGDRVEYPAGESDRATIIRQHIERARAERATAQARLNDIAQRYEALPAVERDAGSDTAVALANEYAEANATVLQLGQNEQTFTTELRRELGVTKPGTPIAVMIESQSDYAQSANSTDGPIGVPPGPFTNTKTAFALNTARFLIDSADRDVGMIGWSDGANRVRNANLPIPAAKLVYDELTPSVVRSLMASLGFKHVKIEKTYIKANGHWTMELTPEMRKAIKSYGLPALGVLAAMSVPQDAQAQDGTTSAAALYGTAAGSFAAGGLLVAMMNSKKLRRLVQENREISRALLRDDLTGLSNKTAHRLAIESIDRDPATSWIAFDGWQFKKVNDLFGHPEGDKALQHFGATIHAVAKDLDVPLRGFRAGGDEFAMAVPNERAAEVLRAVEERSAYTKDGVTTKLTGAIGSEWGEADVALAASKEAAKVADPSLRRTEGAALKLYSNPIGPALMELKKYPSAAAVGLIGYAMGESDNEQVRRAGVPTMVLAALSAIGSDRLLAGKDALGSRLVEAMRQSPEGAKLVRAFNPDALVPPDVRQAIITYERETAKGRARAAEFSRTAQRLGPEGDRRVSDVIEGEDWESTAAMNAKQVTDIMAVASELSDEYDRLAKAQVAAGTLAPSRVNPKYAGPRRYAYFDALDALADAPSGGGGGRRPAIAATKQRTLDIPIREAEAALADATARGDADAIAAANNRLDEAHAVQMSKRIELGEIREASYRAAIGIEKAHANVASAKLFDTIRNVPGAAHPEWVQAVDEVIATRDALKQATPATQDAAQAAANAATVALDEITKRYKAKGGDYVSLPDVPSLGVLRGAVVKRDIAHSLEGFGEPGMYGRALKAWKEIKTVFNPGTSIGNILSNVTALHMGEVPVWLQPYYLTQAVRDLRGYGEATRALAEAGVLNVNSVNADGDGVAARDLRSEAGLEQLVSTTRPETRHVLRAQGITEEGAAAKASRRRVGRMAAGAAIGAAKGYDPDHPENAVLGAGVGALAGAAFGAKTIRRVYDNEDNIARMAVFLRRRKLGDSIEQATEAAINSLGNFRTRSPALKLVSSTVSPFILYQAKAVPAFARNVVDHPWKYLTLMGAWAAMNELSKQDVGEVPETDVPLNQRKTYGYFFPGFTQLPFGDERGNKAAVDVARWTPMSGLTTGAPPGSIPEAFSDDGSALVTPGGPVIDAALRGSNVDPYKKEPRLKRDRPVSENAATLVNDAADFVLPSALGFHATRLKADVDNADWAKFKNDLLGPTGLKPSYVRPGAAAMDAAFILRRSLSDMRHDFRTTLRANKDPERVKELSLKYQRDVAQALVNFKARTGAPPREIVDEYLTAGP